MEYCNHAIYRLPDITMCGGDTTPWNITLVNDEGRTDIPSNNSIECILTLSPYGRISGVGLNAVSVSPVLQKIATVMHNGSTCTATILFGVEDTLHLRGKYIYQIEVINGDSNRVSQGNLTILENKNRKVGALQ